MRKVEAPLNPTVRADMERLRGAFGFEMPVGNVCRAYGLWSAVIGAILFDAFGRYAQAQDAGIEGLSEPVRRIAVRTPAAYRDGCSHAAK